MSPTGSCILKTGRRSRPTDAPVIDRALERESRRTRGQTRRAASALPPGAERAAKLRACESCRGLHRIDDVGQAGHSGGDPRLRRSEEGREGGGGGGIEKE